MNRYRMWMRFLGRLWVRQDGLALLEFAIIFPFFFLLLFGGIEVSRLILIQQHLEKSGYALADIVTRYDPATPAVAAGEISLAELTTNVFPQYSRLMRPYDDVRRQAVIITSLRHSPAGTTIMWQVAGGGSLSGCDSKTPQNCVRSIVNNLAPASIGPAVAGTNPSFPPTETNFINAIPTTGATGDTNIVVLEAFYFYRPILEELLDNVSGVSQHTFSVPPRIFVKRTYFKPRNGRLYALPPTFPVS